MKSYHLALLGFGNVGKAFARLLQTKATELRDQYGIGWKITGVASRRIGWLANPDGFDVNALLAGNLQPHSASLRGQLPPISNLPFWRAILFCTARRAARCSLQAGPGSGLQCVTAAQSQLWKASATTDVNI